MVKHFIGVLNRPPTINVNAINILPMFCLVMETRKAIQHLPSIKAHGVDAIPAEIYDIVGSWRTTNGIYNYIRYVGISVGTNCNPLIVDLFSFYYERDFMISLSILLKHLTQCLDI